MNSASPVALPISELDSRMLKRLKITYLQPCCRCLCNGSSNLSMLPVPSMIQRTLVTWWDLVLNDVKGCKDSSIQQAHSVCYRLTVHPEQVLLQINRTQRPGFATTSDLVWHFHLCKVVCIKSCFSSYEICMSVMLSLNSKMTSLMMSF